MLIEQKDAMHATTSHGSTRSGVAASAAMFLPDKLRPFVLSAPSSEHDSQMSGKPKKTPREKDLTSRYFSGKLADRKSVV